MTLIVMVIFECPRCVRNARGELTAPDDWVVIKPSSTPGVLRCDKCGEGFQIAMRRLPYRFQVTLLDYPTTDVFSSELTSVGPGGESKVTDDPFFEFLSSYLDMLELLMLHGAEGRNPSRSPSLEINKLVLSGLISAMEAYLVDTVTMLVDEEVDATRNLLRHDPLLSSQSLTLFEAWDNSLAVEKRIQASLRGRIYHRLDDVETLYRNAFGVHIFPSSVFKERLRDVIKLRHDIVHRNGKTAAGHAQDFSRARVKCMMKEVHDFVVGINDELFKSVIEASEHIMKNAPSESGPPVVSE